MRVSVEASGKISALKCALMDVAQNVITPPISTQLYHADPNPCHPLTMRRTYQ